MAPQPGTSSGRPSPITAWKSLAAAELEIARLDGGRKEYGHGSESPVVIAEVIPRVRLVDDIDQSIDRIHLGAANVNALRRNDGGQPVVREWRADMLVPRGLSQADPGAVMARSPAVTGLCPLNHSSLTSQRTLQRMGNGGGLLMLEPMARFGQQRQSAFGSGVDAVITEAISLPPPGTLASKRFISLRAWASAICPSR
jgi:hypothetical protein